MAITRILQSSFWWGDPEYDALFPNDIETSMATTGTNDLLLPTLRAVTKGFGTEGSYTDPLASAITQCRIGFMFYAWSTATAQSSLIMGLGKTDHTTEIISLYYDESNARLELKAGTTSLGTYNYPMNSNASAHPIHIGIDVKIDGAAGWAYLYINGEAVISFSGDTNDGGADFDVLILGHNASSIGGWSQAFWTDVYWDETTGEGSAAQCPKLIFQPVTPNGNGNYAQWDGSDGNQVNNYQLIDEFFLFNTADYVESQAAAEFDSYALNAAPADDVNTVNAVIVFVYGLDDGAGGPDSISLGTRLSGVDLMGADIALPTSYGVVFERQTTKPGGGAWTTTDIDSTEIVLESA